MYNVISATGAHKTIIENLLQFYMYDFSEFTKADVEENGLFADYKPLAAYWIEENRFPYLIRSNSINIGFVLVQRMEAAEQSYFSIAEFFVLKKYRLQGAGKAAAKQVFDLHKGKWEVFQTAANKPAQAFWEKVIDEYAGGKFTERFEQGRRMQAFENR